MVVVLIYVWFYAQRVASVFDLDLPYSISLVFSSQLVIILVMQRLQRLKTRSNSAFRLMYHLVLVTKFRHDTLTGEMLERLEEIFDLTLRKWDCELIEFGGAKNHIHVLFEAIPSVDMSKLVNNLKTVSSRLMRKEYSAHLKQFYWSEKPMFWGGSYALITVGSQAPLAKLIEYVQNQEKPE